MVNLEWSFWGHVEGDCKCCQQKHGENNHPHKCNENPSKHNYVDANTGEVGTESNQVNPRQKDGNHPNLPLPFQRTHAWCPEHWHKDDGEYKHGNFEKLDPVTNVTLWLIAELRGLHKQTDWCKNYDDHSTSKPRSTTPFCELIKKMPGRVKHLPLGS